MGQSFTDEELEKLKERVRERESAEDTPDRGPDDRCDGGSDHRSDPSSDAPLLCPHCGSPLDRREVQPRPDVAYVRERIWLLCGRCGRSGVIDRPGRKGRH